MFFRREQRQQPAPEPEKPKEEPLDLGLQVHAAVAEGLSRGYLKRPTYGATSHHAYDLQVGDSYKIDASSPTISISGHEHGGTPGEWISIVAGELEGKKAVFVYRTTAGQNHALVDQWGKKVDEKMGLVRAGARIPLEEVEEFTREQFPYSDTVAFYATNVVNGKAQDTWLIMTKDGY